jgi:ABC-type polysaccharide/polyol phosphate export permease
MTSSELSSPPITYDSARRGPVALEELRGIFQYRDLIFQLVRRDIVARYKRSVLGVAWTMVQPLGMMVILTVVFSQLFHLVQGYPVYILSGLIGWTFFSQTTNAAIHQMVWGGQLLRRIYLPRTAFAVSAIGTGLVNIVLSLIPLALIMLVIGVPVGWSVLLLPFSLMMLAAFSLGIALLLSSAAVYFPDVAEMYQVVLVGWMYLTPIIYPKEILPEPYRFWLLNLNPMYHLLETFRMPLYYGTLPDWPTLVIAAGLAAGTLAAGWLLFSRNADGITYHV